MTGESPDQISRLTAEIKSLKAQNNQLQEEINKRDATRITIPSETNILRVSNSATLSRSENNADTPELERKMREMSVELDCLRADNREVNLFQIHTVLTKPSDPLTS